MSVASKVADRAKQAIKGELGEQVDKSANDLGKLAKTLRFASEQLEGNIAAPYVEKAASQIDRLSTYVEDADALELLRKVEKVGREKPLLYVGAAVALGFVGGRFLKSSAQGRSQRGAPAKESSRANVSQSASPSRGRNPKSNEQRNQAPAGGDGEQRI